MFDITPVIHVPTLITAVVASTVFGVPIAAGLRKLWRAVTGPAKAASR
jgi:hypothetical protein